MDQYVTGAMIRQLREAKGITQLQLAGILNVSDKAVSKWETGRGYPDITLMEPLASALGVSVMELFSGQKVMNTNRSFNMFRMKFHVCPICGNVILGTGEALISCCGITLPPLEAEPADEDHSVTLEPVEDEYYVTVDHEMSKRHYISFIAAVRDDGYEMRKLYPEWQAEARFKMRWTKYIYCYCNQHGLFRVSVKECLGRNR